MHRGEVGTEIAPHWPSAQIRRLARSQSGSTSCYAARATGRAARRAQQQLAGRDERSGTGINLPGVGAPVARSIGVTLPSESMPVMAPATEDLATPLVSVVIPTRNRAHCLPRALESVQAQDGLGTHFGVETIVVDDGSTDETPRVVRRYSAVRSIHLPSSRGVSAALNEGVRASTGAYITFLGDDDEWLPHKLVAQVSLLEAHREVGVVYGQALVRFGDRQHLYPDIGRAPSGWVFGDMLTDNFCGHHAALLVRREALARAGSFDETLTTFEDFDLSLRLARCARFLFAPGAVTIYNLSSQGSLLTGVATGTAATDAARVVEKAVRLLADYGEDAALVRAIRARDPLELASAFVGRAVAASGCD
jgi:hypothetical protein